MEDTKEKSLTSPSKQLLKERYVFNAGVVFIGTAVAQYLVPSPLDSLLLPAAISYWYVQSGQESWLLDSLYDKSSITVRSACTNTSDYIGGLFSSSKKEKKT